MHKPMSSPEDKISGVSSARKLLLLLVLVGAIVLSVYYLFFNDSTTENIAITTSNTETEPAFTQEGVLWFLSEDQQDTLQQIAIEVADDQQQRAQGMMYRTTMDEGQGMLFIHDQPEVQSYWMKNTKIPLDIIYVGESKEIVTIYQGVMPYSEKSIPSSSEALYVVEVNAGFTGRHQIEEGDYIDFEILD